MPDGSNESPPAAGGQQAVLLLAGSDPALTRATAAHLRETSSAPLRLAILGPASAVDAWPPPARPHLLPEHPKRALEQLQLVPGEPLLLVEDGARTGAEWDRNLLTHSAHPNVACVAASTNHARGPERLLRQDDGPESGGIPPREWFERAAELSVRSEGRHEDVRRVSSPLLAWMDPASTLPELAAWLAARATTELSLPPVAGRLLIAKDVAAWRRPRRASSARAFLRVAVAEPLFDPGAHEPEPRPEEVRDWIEQLGGDIPSEACHPAAHLALGGVCTRAGFYRQGIEHSRRCLDHWPASVEARLWLTEASVQCGLGLPDEVVGTLIRGFGLSPPRRAQLLSAQGESWRQQGESEQAARCFREALELDGRQAAASNGMGRLCLQSGDFDGALPFLRAAVHSDPLRAGAWHDYGRALALTGSPERARRMLARALFIQPGHRGARKLLGRIARLASHQAEPLTVR